MYILEIILIKIVYEKYNKLFIFQLSIQSR